MFTSRAVFAAVVVCFGACAPLQAAETLTLDHAFQRVVDSHPDLAALRFSESSRAAEIERSSQRPPLTFDASVENALGTGAASGLRGAELTLSLGSVIERGDKRASRIALAERRRDGIELLREATELDLLAEVARRYLDAVYARQATQLIRNDLQQRDRLVEATTRRIRAGAASEVARLATRAARERVAADLDQFARRERHARRRLALLWGDAQADFELADADLSTLPIVPDYDELMHQLAATPELRRFAHESRVREARLQLARSSQSTDLDWRVGVRRLQAEQDWGLVGSLSIPFGNRQRAQPGIRAAEAELATIELEREGESRALQSTLAEAWSQLDLSVATAQRIDASLQPALQRGAEVAEQSYRAGAASYMEWAQLQSDVTAVRRERLDASLAAHRALIELQRLTGQTLQVTNGPNTDATP